LAGSGTDLKWNLLKNIGYLTLGSQAANLLQFVFFLYYARTFGDALVGKYWFGFSFTYVLSVLADLGVSAFLTCEVAKDPAGTRSLFARALLLRLISLTFLSLIGTGVVAIFLGGIDRDTVSTLVLMGLYQIFSSIADVFLAELKGHDKMGTVALLTVLIRLLIAVSGITLIAQNFDYLWVISCFPVCAFLYLVSCLAASLWLHRGAPIEVGEFRLAFLAKQALPFAFTMVFVEVLYNADTLLLRALTNDQEVGTYSVAQRIVMVFLGLLACVFTALLPTFSRLYVESVDTLSELAGRVLRYLVLLGLPASTGLFAVSYQAIVLLFTDTFAHAALGMRILSWTVVLGCASITPSVLLTASGRQKAKSIAIGFCLGSNLIANCILIPWIGWTGAAWARLMAEAMQLAVLGWLAADLLRKFSWWNMLAKPAVSCLMMYFVLRQFQSVNIFALTAIGIVAYFACLAALRGFDTHELDWISAVFRKVGVMC
jgi:O-antigen/teichoic acid export membrane protein